VEFIVLLVAVPQAVVGVVQRPARQAAAGPDAGCWAAYFG